MWWNALNCIPNTENMQRRNERNDRYIYVLDTAPFHLYAIQFSLCNTSKWNGIIIIYMLKCHFNSFYVRCLIWNYKKNIFVFISIFNDSGAYGKLNGLFINNLIMITFQKKHHKSIHTEVLIDKSYFFYISFNRCVHTWLYRLQQ